MLGVAEGKHRAPFRCQKGRRMGSWAVERLTLIFNRLTA
jgi:hypothetical protein